MNRAKISAAFFFLFLFSLFLLPAQSTGFNLSNSIYNEFHNTNYRIRTQNLVTTSENEFPFNVYVTIQHGTTFRTESTKQFLLVIDQSQALKHKDLVKTLLETIEAKKYGFPVTVLFSYEDSPKVIKKELIQGTNVYLNNANINENTTALLLDLDSTKDALITSSKGISSPSFLVKNALNLFAKNNIPTDYPFYYVSQQNKFQFFVDQQLDFFFKQEIPAIKFSFEKHTSDQDIYSLCSEYIDSYSQNPDFLWDQHFIILKLFNKYHRLNERNIVRLIITLFFMCILFIFLLGFVNSSIKNQTWNRIRKIWFSVPVIFILVLGAFFTGKGLFLLFAKNMSYTGKIVFLFITQVILSIVYTSAYLIIQIKKGVEVLSEKSIDFLIVFACSINLFVFTLIDISLFPIFLLNVIISILLLILNIRFIHIILLVFMIVPYVPYVHTIFSAADLNLFQQIYTTNNFYFIGESLLITPAILTYFRILTSFKTKLFNYKRLILTTSVALGIFSIIISTTGVIMTKKHSNSYVIKEQIDPEISKTSVIQISWEDKKVFTDNIRTLKISIPENTIQCEVTISTTGPSPVLYSNSDYIMTSPNIASFQIPTNPGKDLQFTYGYETIESSISVVVIYFDSLKGTYLKNIQRIQTHTLTGGTDE